MIKLAEFISRHLTDDTTRLILDRAKWPEIDMDIAVNSIESRRKLKGKVQEWYDNPQLIFPVRISAEQCSSSATAAYKAAFAEHIACSSGTAAGEWKIADLTGGLGVDSWFFSQKASKVFYNEMQKTLCDAVRYNFSILEASGIEIHNNEISSVNIEEIISDFGPDIIYMDPARRGEGGKKVFLIEECTPDVLTLKDEIFRICRHILIKLSPMADIAMVCSRLGKECREVHVIAAGGECKELLIWMDREWEGEYLISAVELHESGDRSVFSFTMSEEKAAKHINVSGISDISGDTYLFEPGKSLMKAGAFSLISSRFGIPKLGQSTHYYTTDIFEKADELSGYGKIYRILNCSTLDKRSVKAAGKNYPKAEVTARNIPMDTEALRKKLGVTSGDDAHIFGLRSDASGNILLCTKRMFDKDLESHRDKDQTSGEFCL